RARPATTSSRRRPAGPTDRARAARAGATRRPSAIAPNAGDAARTPIRSRPQPRCRPRFAAGLTDPAATPRSAPARRIPRTDAAAPTPRAPQASARHRHARSSHLLQRVGQALDRDHLHALVAARLRRIRLGHDRALEAVRRRLLEPLLAVGHRPDLARQPDLAERDRLDRKST